MHAQQELTEKFHREFPDGSVPVRIAAGHSEAEGAMEWIEATYEGLQIIDDLGLDPRAAEKARELWLDDKRNRAILTLTQQGLSLREVARYLEVAPRSLTWELGSDHLHHQSIEDLMDADDMLTEGTSAEEVAQHVSLPLQTIYALEHLHG